MKLVKDRRILDLVSRLGLEKRGWVIADDWEADLCAIGIARATQERHCVYVSIFKAGEARYHYESDTPSGPDPADVTTVETGTDVTYEELLDALERHLA